MLELITNRGNIIITTVQPMNIPFPYKRLIVCALMLPLSKV